MNAKRSGATNMKEGVLRRTLLLIPTVVLCYVAGAGAQTSDVGEESPIIAENANLRHRSPITLTAKDANLSEILRVLAERSGMNFVAGEGVHREKITLILNKTPLDEAINLLVRAAGLAYEVIGNSVLIAEPEKLKEEVGLSSYVVKLKYAQANEVAKMLSDLTKNIKIDEGGNRLVCYTSPRVILEIERIVRSIDHPHILVLLETRLIEVSLDKLDQRGMKWNELAPLEMQIAYPESQLNKGINRNKWVKMPLDFDFKLDMMLQNGDAHMLMNSKLTTTNNREASLHIGEIVPYTVQQYNMGSNASGGGANLTVEKERVGVLITMTPHVNEENQITLNLAPEVSNITAWKGQFGDMPLVRTRKTNTTIRVEDGQKIFLAGLLSEEETFTTFKVPVLGEIPIIGMLFQNRRKDIIRKNLIIEVVPRIIRDPKEIQKILEEDTSETSGETGTRGGRERTQQQRPTVQPITNETGNAVNDSVGQQ